MKKILRDGKKGTLEFHINGSNHLLFNGFGSAPIGAVKGVK